MFIIIHNKLINKCYFGTFGKHSVFGNGDVSNRKPNLRNSRSLSQTPDETTLKRLGILEACFDPVRDNQRWMLNLPRSTHWGYA